MSKIILVELIKKWGDKTFFVGEADANRIGKIEQMLGVKLPESYKWFLNKYGHGGVFGVEIFGSGLAEIPSCVSSTISWREFGLPEYLVVIEDDGADWIYCLDTSSMVDNECPVVDWAQGEGIGKKKFTNFIEFLLQRFEILDD